MKQVIALLGASCLLAGCSLFVPYHSEFSCTADRNYGKCTNVEGAYSEALGGTLPADTHYVGEEDVGKNAKTKKKKEGEPETPAQAAPDSEKTRSRYKDAEYSELAKIIESPVTPVVKPPEVLRTLVVAYSSAGEKTLYMPRYIFYFASDAGFVLGDYLSTESPQMSTVLTPNAARKGE